MHVCAYVYVCAIVSKRVRVFLNVCFCEFAYVQMHVHTCAAADGHVHYDHWMDHSYVWLRLLTAMFVATTGWISHILAPAAIKYLSK